jgi:hypothetical protein
MRKGKKRISEEDQYQRRDGGKNLETNDKQIKAQKKGEK